jgi:curved DNA-binding protein CbpA
VPAAIHKQAEALLARGGSGGGEQIRQALELVLTNDAGVQPSRPSGFVDAGALLKRGLTSLANNPHEALNIPLGAQTADVKKAYRKMALKYHPDKNPKTTPLFQAISQAQEKLSDTIGRNKEVQKAKERDAAGDGGAGFKPGSGAEAQYARERERERARNEYKQPGPGSGAGSNKGPGQAQSANPYPSAYARAQAQFQQRQEQEQKAREAAGARAGAAQAKYPFPTAGAGAGAKPGPGPGSGPRNTAEAEYARAANQRTQQQRSEPFYVPRPAANPTPTPDETGDRSDDDDDAREVERDARAFRARKEQAERLQRQADAKAAAQSRASQHQQQQQDREAKARDDKENAERARQHREEVLRQGQQAYNDEVRRRRAAQDEHKQKMQAEYDRAKNAATEAAEARRKEERAAGASAATADANMEKFLRGYKQAARPSAASQAAFSAGVRAASGTGAGAGTAAGGVGTTFTANHNGEAKATGMGQGQGQAAAQRPTYTGAAAYMQKVRKGLIPSRPFGLSTVAVGNTQVELSWQQKPAPGERFIPRCEFQWRLLSVGGQVHRPGVALENWQSASKLISSQNVRKKNLRSGGVYEFRVRAVTEEIGSGAANGDLIDAQPVERSEWCDSLTVALKADNFYPQSRPVDAAYEQSGAGAGAGAGPGAARGTINHNSVGSSSSSSYAAAGGPRSAGGPMSYVDPLADQAGDSYGYPSSRAETKSDSSGASGSNTGAASAIPGKGTGAGGKGKADLRQLEREFQASDSDSDGIIDNLEPIAAPTGPGSQKNLHRTPSKAWGNKGDADASPGTGSDVFDKTHYHRVYDHNASFGVGNAQEVSDDDGAGSSDSGSGSDAAEVPDEDELTAPHAGRFAKSGLGAASSKTKGAGKGSSPKRGKLGKRPDGNLMDHRRAQPRSGGSIDSGDDEDEAGSAALNTSVTSNASTASEQWDPQQEAMFDLFAPPQPLATAAAAAGANGNDNGSGNAQRMLGKEKYEHAVHELPDKASRVIGLLIPGMCVQAMPPKNIRAGGGLGAAGGLNWIFCRFHRTAAVRDSATVGRGSTKGKQGEKSTAAPLGSAASAASAQEWGWALLAEAGHTYLAPAAATGYSDSDGDGDGEGGEGSRRPAGAALSKDNDRDRDRDKDRGRDQPSAARIAEQWDEDERTWDDYAAGEEGGGVGGGGGDAYESELYTHDDQCDVWVEHTDESGHNYYVNERSGESKWEAPEWVQEVDPATGVQYYVKLEPLGAAALHSTWSRPEHFAQIRRLNVAAAEAGEEQYETDDWERDDA